MIEVGLGSGRLGRRKCASMIVWSFEGSLGGPAVHDKRPSGEAA